jgi:hypothetical protein
LLFSAEHSHSSSVAPDNKSAAYAVQHAPMRSPALADYAGRMVRGMSQALLETTMPFVSVVGAEIRQLH